MGVTEGGRRHVDWENLEPRDMEDMVVGKGIIESCVTTYFETPTWVTFVFEINPKLFVQPWVVGIVMTDYHNLIMKQWSWAGDCHVPA